MNIERMLLRLSQWARNPPSMRQVMIWAVVIAVCVALAGIEWLGLWPDWLRVNGRL
jgi:hypothetical protein